MNGRYTERWQGETPELDARSLGQGVRRRPRRTGIRFSRRPERSRTARSSREDPPARTAGRPRGSRRSAASIFRGNAAAAAKPRIASRSRCRVAAFGGSEGATPDLPCKNDRKRNSAGPHSSRHDRRRGGAAPLRQRADGKCRPGTPHCEPLGLVPERPHRRRSTRPELDPARDAPEPARGNGRRRLARHNGDPPRVGGGKALAGPRPEQTGDPPRASPHRIRGE